jgi:hypothetical protein
MSGLVDALPSPTGDSIQIAGDWLNGVFRNDSSWWPAQDVFACELSHVSDEYLNGFIQTQTMDTWRSSGATVLWCRLGITESTHGHPYPATCIFRQIIGEHALERQWQAFSYNHRGVGNVTPCFPPDFAEVQEKFKRQQQQEREKKLGKSASFEQAVGRQESDTDVEEIVLLSLLLQARRKGFPVTIHDVDLNDAENFKESLISTFVRSLYHVSERVFFILENLGTGASIVMGVILRVAIALRSQATERNVQIIVAAKESPDVMEVLSQYPTVMSDSEYKGMQCLSFDQLTFLSV